MKNANLQTYNGHKTKAHWNVSLWMLNDELLYQTMQHHAEAPAYLQKTKVDALRDCLAFLPHETPDGFPINAETLAPVFYAEVDQQIQHS